MLLAVLALVRAGVELKNAACGGSTLVSGQNCTNQTITCESGKACEVSCYGGRSCFASEVVVNGASDLTVKCSGQEACQMMEVNEASAAVTQLTVECSGRASCGMYVNDSAVNDTTPRFMHINCGSAANCTLSCSAYGACNQTRFDRQESSAKVNCDGTNSTKDRDFPDVTRCHWKQLAGCALVKLDGDAVYSGNMGLYRQTGKKKNGKPVYKSTDGDKFTNCGSFVKKCDNTCFYANDGYCDDNGLGAQFNKCPTGTDCADCTGRSDGDGVTCSDRYLYYKKMSDTVNQWVVEDNAGFEWYQLEHKEDNKDFFDVTDAPKPPGLFWLSRDADLNWIKTTTGSTIQATCQSKETSFYMDWQSNVQPTGDMDPSPSSCENPQFCSCGRVENATSPSLCEVVYAQWWR